MHFSSARQIGWIGTGVMGGPMAGHLLAAGHRLTVHTRTPAKARHLVERGARWAATPAEAAAGADVVFSMVGLPEDVEEVHLGASGTLSAQPLPRIIVDMTTSRPSLAVRIHEAARSRGVGCADAPVSGGDVGAVEAALSIMVGADAEVFDAVRPLLERMGRRVIRQGGPGAGQHTKLVNQILIATTMIGACEGLIYARKAGLDPSAVLESVGSGAAGSWTINTLGPRMIDRKFGPGFRVDHFIKDLSIALDESAHMGLAVPGLALARQLYESVRDLDGGRGGRLGTHALMLALERRSGLGGGPETENPQVTCPAAGE